MAYYYRDNEDSFLVNKMSNTIGQLELKILELMAQGFSDKKIARLLNMGCIQDHIKLIYKKLDAKSKTEAVIKAISKSILSLDLL